MGLERPVKSENVGNFLLNIFEQGHFFVSLTENEL